MKLLLDQNLSRKLIGMLANEFPNTEHVLNLGMEKKEDTDIWDFAASKKTGSTATAVCRNPSNTSSPSPELRQRQELTKYPL